MTGDEPAGRPTGDRADAGRSGGPSRRRLLRATAGFAAMAGLAGCSQGGDGDSGGGTEPADSEDSTTTTTTTTVDCEETTLDENITSDTTLRGACTYTLASEVQVLEDATLTIEPGATIEAERGSMLLVYDGALVARGTEDESITVRGTQSIPEHWKGIVVESGAEANALEHVSVSDAGAYNGYYEANLAIGSRDPGRMTVRNCAFTNSAAAGVRVERFGTLAGFGNNRFAANEGPPLDIKADQLVALEGSSAFDDGGGVLVRLGRNSVIESDTTLPDMGVPYRMSAQDSYYLGLAATVEIEPGTRFEFGSGAGLLVGSGALVAVGEPDAPIEFVGTNERPGHWRGIVVRSYADANELDHVVLSDGGAYNGFYRANLCVGPQKPARMTVRNSEISDSSEWGIYLGQGDLVSRGNTYSNNAKGSVRRPDE